ncbi:MAG: prepilin-type N-terminal cleavage/methylation domain-containing protein [Planctomycetes bacterium]|nr:prepilin-type N-terminal cleavage/methylation domain-containing protein [Planctomycetota bacterium]
MTSRCGKKIRRGGGAGGFTMIELMVALSLAMVIGYAVFFMYTTSISSYSAAEKELKFLSGFRTSTDFLEREVNSMCWKGGYKPYSGGGVLKPINDGMFTTLLFEHCMCFYTSLDGVHIDRVAYYFNPAEDQLEWEDGEDNDNDDPEGQTMLPMGDPREGLLLMYDDKGSFMRRRWRDEDLVYADYSSATFAGDPDGLPIYALPAGHMSCGTGDLGEVMADGFTDILFWYLYTTNDDEKLYYAEIWPFDQDGDTSADDTGLSWGGVGISYLTVPLGVQIDFHYDLDGADRVLSKMMIIYSSRWQEYQSYAAP